MTDFKTPVTDCQKNTKSETSSALGLSELICGNDGADIVASSNDDAQASIVFDAIDTMRMLIDPDDLDTKRNQRYILNKNSNSKVFKLSDRTKKIKKDVTLISQSWTKHTRCRKILLKVNRTITVIKKIIQNSINITTEGFVIEGYLDDELKNAMQLLIRRIRKIRTQKEYCHGYTRKTVNRRSGMETAEIASG